MKHWPSTEENDNYNEDEKALLLVLALVQWAAKIIREDESENEYKAMVEKVQ